MKPSTPRTDKSVVGLSLCGSESASKDVYRLEACGPQNFAHPSKGGNLHSEAVGRSQQRDRLAAFCVSGGFSDGGSMMSRRNDKLMFLTSKSTYVWIKFSAKGLR
jgi:hypothetical protein